MSKQFVAVEGKYFNPDLVTAIAPVDSGQRCNIYTAGKQCFESNLSLAEVVEKIERNWEQREIQ